MARKQRIDGVKLRALRDERGLSQLALECLTEEMGTKVDERTIRRLENNESSGSSATIRIIAKALKVKPKDLLQTDYDFPEVSEVGKFHKLLTEETLLFLREKLRGRDDYQPLEMEIGVIEERPQLSDIEQLGDSRRLQKYEHGRVWRPFAPESLLVSRDVYILSSDVGTGKTTFLRYLQQTILERGTRLPILLHAAKIEKWDYTDVDTLALLLAERFRAWLPIERSAKFFREVFGTRILLFVDGLDQIGGAGTEYRHVLNKLLKICRTNLIVASRHAAVESQERNSEVKFLRLKPFGEKTQREYFSQHYQTARQLCERDQNLMMVPMLACMVRTLIEKGEDKGIKNRASLYKRFVDYILHDYVHEESKMSKDEQQTVRSLLREISYEALKSENPMVQKIPLGFCWELTHKYKDIEIDKLPKYGLVNLLVDRFEGIDDYVYFSHQSFQEYLAAEYVAQSDVRINKILAEKWNPKWKEVIKFLTGLLGHGIIEKILAEKDNPIHSKLFLSAELVPETDVTVTLRNKMSKEIEKLLYHQIFFADAADCLLHVDETKAISEFTGKLDDADNRIVQSAIWALGECHETLDVEIVENIASKLDDEDKGIVCSAIDALGKLQDKVDVEIVEKIASKLDDEDIGVGTAALWTLEECCDKVDAKIVMKIASIPAYAPDQIVDSANRILGKIHAKIVNEIASKLDDEDKGIVCSAIDALGKLQDKVDVEIVEKIANKLDDEDDQIVRRAIDVFASLQDKVDIRIVEKIASKLDDEDDQIAQSAIWALGALKDKVDLRIAEKIAKKLDDEDREIVRGAIWALGECHDKLGVKIVSKIAKKLDDKDRWIVLRAIWTFGKLQDKVNADVVMKIASKLCGNDEEIRDEAVSVLIECHNKVDVKTMKTVASKLDDEDKENTRNAILTLATLQDELDIKIVEKIDKKLDDEDRWIVKSAIWALGNLQDMVDIRIVKKIAKKLDDEDKGIVLQAIWALGNLEDKVDLRIAEKIAKKLDDEDDLIVCNAIWALEVLQYKFDGWIVERIATKLDDEDRRIVQRAIIALANLQDMVDIRIMEKIVSLLDDEDSWIVQKAIDALGELQDKVDIKIVEKVASKLDDEDKEIVRDAIWTLGKLQDKVDIRIVEKIASMLDDENEQIVERAIWALEALQDKLDAKILMKLILQERTYAYNVVKKMYQLGKLEFLNWDH